MFYWLLKKISGASDPEKGARAVGWGVGIAILLWILIDTIVLNTVFQEIRGPALNASIPVLLSGVISMFGAQAVGSSVAAYRAPSLPVRHAILAGIVPYLAAVVGPAIHWNTAPWWKFPAQGLAALAGAVVGGLVVGQFRGRHGRR